MFTERIQVLMTKAQRRRLEEEARARGTSVGALIREAVDTRAHRAPLEQRRKAFEEIRAMRGSNLSVQEMERIVDEEREEWLDRLSHRRRRTTRRR